MNSTEMNRVKARREALEPLAYLYERHQQDLFKVCSDLYHEYRSIENMLKDKLLREATSVQG